MADSKDIQAREPTAEELLLVDLLYGELDEPAAEAARKQLADGEQADELAAFEDLRSLFRELPDEDPPPAISARLLHAAAEAAPKSSAGSAAAAAAAGGGLLDRLLGFFRPLYANPALAAATMFVLVAGVAGALYLTGNFETATPTTDSTGTPPAADQPVATPPAEEASEPTAQPDDVRGNTYELDLTDESGAGEAAMDPNAPAANKPARAAGGKAGPMKAKPQTTTADGFSADGDDKRAEPPPPPPEPKKRRTKSKDLKKDANRGRSAPSGGVTGSVGDSPLIDAEEVPAEEVPEDEPAPDSERKLEEKAPAPAQQTRQIRVEDLHARAVQAAKDRECEAVRSLGSRIRQVDPTYYKNVYSRDKRLSACLSSPTRK